MKKGTHNEACAGANHKHGGRATQATFFVQSVGLMAFIEDVRDPETHAGENKIE